MTMTRISAQVSIYPLRQPNLAPAIEEAVQIFRARRLEFHPGAMSTLVIGDDEIVFAALRDALRGAATRGDVVMVASLSNACPPFRPPVAALSDK
jgi:uncharacterized protein YqgV (UPF0045/DUF77 family)